MSFLAALQQEIDTIEASIEANPDPRLVKLHELRRVKALYETGANPPASSPQSASQEPRTPRSGRQASPERAQAIAIAKRVLEGRTEPMRTADILTAVTREGVELGGTSPVSNFSALLYHQPEFESHGRRGWTLKGQALETKESTADLHSLPDQPAVVDPEAQGREAVPGGGA